MFEGHQAKGMGPILILIVQMLECFNQGITLRGWLSPLRMAWLVPVFILVLNIALKGTLPGFIILPALVLSYVLMGTLILQTLMLFVLSQLPGQVVTLSSPEAVKAGGLLFRLSFVGLGILIKNCLIFFACCLGAILSPRRPSQPRLAGV